MARRQAAVLSGSSAGSSPSMRVVPSAMAPNSRARCEIDLSPGTFTVPRRLVPPSRLRGLEGRAGSATGREGAIGGILWRLLTPAGPSHNDGRCWWKPMDAGEKLGHWLRLPPSAGPQRAARNPGSADPVTDDRGSNLPELSCS